MKEIKNNFDKSNEQLKYIVTTQNASITADLKNSVAKIEASVAALQVRQDIYIAEIKESVADNKSSIAEI